MNTKNVHTLTDLIREVAKSYPDRPALSFVGDTPWTYAELFTSAAMLSEKLRQAGVEPGQRLALLAESSPQWGIAYFAGLFAGAVMVPILPDFKPGEISTITAHSEAVGLISSKKMLNKSGENTSLTFTMTLEEVVERPTGQQKKDFAGYEPSEPKETDTACIIYTSGTTGNSKGVVLSHQNIITNALAAEKIPDWTEETTALSVLPLAHTYEFTIGFVTPLLKGGTIYYLRRPPSTSVLLPALAKVRPQIMLSVPLLIEKVHAGIIKTRIDNKFYLRLLYKLPPVRKAINRVIGKGLAETFGGRLHFFGIGGAPLSPATEKFLRETDFPFSIGYGLTETSPLIAGGLASEIPFQSTGKVLENLEVQLDHTASTSNDGEILVKGPSVMQEYYKNPDQTAEVLSNDRWFRTGDLGYLSPEGFLFITGRVKNMLLGPNGENIYPEQIETQINLDRYVLESLVLQKKSTKELAVLVHLDYENFTADRQDGRIMQEIHNLERHIRQGEGKNEQDRLQEKINLYLDELKQKINREISGNARISDVIEQKTPFERTPTKKIKRYLYTVK
ncbi:MAG: AMP-binding protein [Spirochaetota bacterium]